MPTKEDEPNDDELEEIGRLVKEGYDSGRVDTNGRYVSWTITYQVWRD